MARVRLPDGLFNRTADRAIADLADAAPGSGYRFQDDRGTERLVSFSEMERETTRVAGAFQVLGARAGDRVVLVLADSHDFVRAFLGAVRAGLIPAPVTAPLGLGRVDVYLEGMARLVGLCDARLLVTDPRVKTLLEPVRRQVPGLRIVTPDQLEADADFQPQRRSMEDVCFLQFTSGSTGRPRGVAIEHRNLTANLASMTQAFGDLGLELEVDRAVSWLPLFHDMGLVGFVLLPLYIRNPVVLLTPLSFLKRPRRWLEAISRHRAAISFAPNFAYAMCARRLTDRDVEGLDLSSWKVAGCGAEPIRAGDLERFASRFAPAGFDARALTCAYGLAEATVAVSFSPLGEGLALDEVDTHALIDGGRAVPASPGAASVKIASCGPPLQGMEVKVFAPADRTSARELPERTVGELRLRGPSVTRGYWGEEPGAGELSAGSWLRTGDLGYLAQGRVHVCGRLKDMMIVRGKNYSPNDVEAAAATVDGVQDGVVAFSVQLEDGGGEEVIVAFEHTRLEADEAATIRRLKRRIYDSLGLAVAEVLPVPRGALPRTSSGKLRRYRARDLYQHGQLGARRAGDVASRIATLRKLAAKATRDSPAATRLTTEGDPRDRGSR